MGFCRKLQKRLGWVRIDSFDVLLDWRIIGFIPFSVPANLTGISIDAAAFMSLFKVPETLGLAAFLQILVLGLPMGRLALYWLDFVYPLSIPIRALAFSIGARCRKTLGPRMPSVSATFTCQGRKFHTPNMWF